MTVESTRETMTAYLETLAQRGPFAQYFGDEVTFALVGTAQEVKGRDAVEQFIRYFHEQAFDARPELKSTIIGDVRAAAEFVFVGTHTGEFAGVPASGKEVSVPYAVVYDLIDDSNKHRTNGVVAVLIEKGGSKARAAQIILELIREWIQLRLCMMVTHLAPRGLPHLLLRI
jgi:predicted ester cyclase